MNNSACFSVSVFGSHNSFSVCEHVKRNVIISLQVILSGLVNLSLSVLFRKFYFIMYWMENWSTHSSQTFQAFLSDLSYLNICSVTNVGCIEWLVEDLLVVENYPYDENFWTLIHTENVLFCSSQISLKFSSHQNLQTDFIQIFECPFTHM